MLEECAIPPMCCLQRFQLLSNWMAYGRSDAFENPVHVDDFVPLHLPALKHWAGCDIGAHGGSVSEDSQADLSPDGKVLDESLRADVRHRCRDRYRDGV